MLSASNARNVDLRPVIEKTDFRDFLRQIAVSQARITMLFPYLVITVDSY